jgi:TolB-like protein/cytochrome c-type biogenesis protein CcmH/NrfG
VFLSYASEDGEAAKRIAGALRSAGVEVWFDQSELRGGDVWDQKIRKQIHDCALFIPIISTHTQARTEGYFRLEWHLADQRKLLMTKSRPFLVPVCIDGTPLPDAEVPDSFSAAQWTRLPTGETPPAFVERIAGLLSPEQSQPPPPTYPLVGAASRTTSAANAGTHRSGASRRSKFVASLIALALVLLGGYVALDKFVLSRRVAVTASAPVAQSLLPVPSTSPEKSIAVLPFVDLSEKKDQEYFADGMAEEILDDLTKIPGLTVIGRTSSFQFKGKSDDLRKVGATLGAAHLVEGSVRRSGDHVRVTAQLIRSSDGVHEWSETYDRNVGDSLNVQQEIAVSLARALQVTMDAGTVPKAEVKSPEAYDFFLRGLHAFDQADKAGLEAAANYFEQALRLEPSLTRAQDMLARTYFDQADDGYVPATLGFERARAIDQILLKKDPRSFSAHAHLSRIYADHDWDLASAKREADEAISLNPGAWNGYYSAGIVQFYLGNWDEAERNFRTALSLDPLNPDTHQALGVVLYGAGRFTEAAAEYRRTLEISPSFPYVHSYLSSDLLALKQPEAALREAQLERNEGAKRCWMAVAYHALGRKSESDAALAQLTRDNADAPYSIAVVHASRGEADQAFDWLDRSYQQKDVSLMYIKSERILRQLENDPRYKALLHKMQLPE